MNLASNDRLNQSPHKTPAKPLGNSYWVRPGELLAGEYPLNGDDAESAVRLQDLLLAGITCFIDLTAVDELPPYEGRLPARFGGKPVVHQRFAIRDHDVPDSMQRMTAILDAIDAALAQGAGVYVHCRAGIGRTGTVVGCHLVRRGHDGARAIEMLNSLWQANERAKRWPTVPETEAQQQFVLKFKEDLGTRPLLADARSQLSIYQGALLGLAIGDVLGTALAAPATAGVDLNKTADTMLNNLAALQWSSDAAMTLALADSLLSCKQMQPQDQMQRYLAWQKQGKYNSDSRAVAVPPPVQKALGLWQWKRNPVAGSHDPALIDAHALARCTPVALYFAARPAQALLEAAESARTTSQAPLVLDACRVFAAMLLAIVEGAPLPELFAFKAGKACDELRTIKLKPELERFIDGGWRTAMTQAADEDVLSVLASAVHAVATTNNFQSAVCKSMHKAARPANVAAVCGALAGALYGVQGLPIVWRETLPKVAELLALSERLLNTDPSLTV